MQIEDVRSSICILPFALKILILKPSSLGDVVQALPVLRLLKRHWPESQIYWWADSVLAPLLEGDPDLAGVVRFERRHWALPRYWPHLWNSVRWIRAQAFDLAIDLQGLARSGTFAWLANSKLLIGLDEHREGARGYYDIVVPRRSFHTHAVDWYLGVLEALGVPVHPDITWLPERPAVAAGLRRKWHAETARWIVLQPGARWANKRWPVESYAELLRQLVSHHARFKIAVLGDATDRQLGAALRGVDPQRCLDLTGALSLPEMVEWIRLADLMIANDTGPMHVAAALGTPLVAIFGPTEPRRTGPYRRLGSVVQGKLPCIPCLKPYCAYVKPLECLRLISPAEVLAKAEATLERAATANDHLPLATPAGGLRVVQ
jgi:lipopolysaccharide heptosyltransferase II